VSPDTRGAPLRVIGFWTVVSLVMGNMIGSGVFLLPSSLASFGGGLSLIGWGVSAAGSLLLAVAFARLARLYPVTGGPYAYARAAFGDLAGFLVAWSYWISIWSALAALAVAAVGYLDPFIPGVVRTPWAAATLAIALVWVVVLINVRGVELAGRVQVVTTVLKVLPLAFVAIAGLAAFEPSRFGLGTDGAGDTARGVMAVVTLTLWAFLGLESGTIPAGRVVDPDRTIPRATVTGTVLTTGIYVLGTVGVMSLVPLEHLASSSAPFADAARVVAGDGAAAVIAAGAAISCFGALNGWTLMAGQVPLAAAGDGLFPSLFGRCTSRQTPAAGIAIAGVLASGLVLANASRDLVGIFTFVILLSTLGALVPYVFCALAGLMLRAPGESRVPAGTVVVAALAFVFALVAVGGAGADVVYWGFLLLLAGLPVYVGVVRERPEPVR
jgi:APA family basic amino acid/polyamine antiporter